MEYRKRKEKSRPVSVYVCSQKDVNKTVPILEQVGGMECAPFRLCYIVNLLLMIGGSTIDEASPASGWKGHIKRPTKPSSLHQKTYIWEGPLILVPYFERMQLVQWSYDTLLSCHLSY